MSPGIIVAGTVQESLGVQTCLPQARTGAQERALQMQSRHTSRGREKASELTLPARTVMRGDETSYFQRFSQSPHSPHRLLASSATCPIPPLPS